MLMVYFNAWRRYRKKDIDTLERMHRRVTKLIPELRDLSYDVRLKDNPREKAVTRRSN